MPLAGLRSGAPVVLLVIVIGERSNYETELEMEAALNGQVVQDKEEAVNARY